MSLDTYDLSPILTSLENTTSKKIILQFPPQQISQSFEIHQQLSLTYPSKDFFILSDHLKNSCCIDLVGANHIEFDLLIHFGDACFSQIIQKENVLVVFEKKRVVIEEIRREIEKCWEIIREEDEIIIIVLEQNISYLKEELMSLFNSKEQQEQIQFASYSNQQQSVEKDRIQFINGTIIQKNVLQKKKSLLFIGDNQNYIDLLALEKNYYQINNLFQLSPSNYELKNLNEFTETLLMKRYLQLHNINEQNVFGIIILSPCIHNFQILLEKLKIMLKAQAKKYYIFSLNNITEAKLNNFPEIETFIVLSCQ